MDKKKVINLEKEIKKQQKIIKELTQEDVNDLTIETLQQISRTV